MAIIKCPECKKKISDAVDACPKCGFPISSSSINTIKNDFEQEEVDESVPIIIMPNGDVFFPHEQINEQNEKKEFEKNDTEMIGKNYISTLRSYVLGFYTEPNINQDVQNIEYEADEYWKTGEADVEDEDKDEAADFIREFDLIEKGTKGRESVFIALIFPTPWLLYRKMYVEAIMLALFRFILLGLIIAMPFLRHLAAFILTNIPNLIVAVKGYNLYYYSILRKFDKHELTGKDCSNNKDIQNKVVKIGGVNKFWPILYIIFEVVYVAALFIFVPKYA